MFDGESGSVTGYLPGDIVLRRKGPIMHQGIVLGDDRILHNTPRRGEHISSMQDFRRGKAVRARRLDETQRARALHHAEHAAHGDARRYNLLRNNCEHTVTRATTGNGTSPQLLAVAAGLVVGGIVLAATRHPMAAAAVGYALCRKLRKRSSSHPRRRGVADRVRS